MQVFQLLFFVHILAFVAANECDLRFIRSVYMMTCGKRKRNLSGFTVPVDHAPKPDLTAVWPGLLLSNNNAALSTDPPVIVSNKKRTLEDIPDLYMATGGLRGLPVTITEEEEEFGKMYRREISELLEKCCKVTMVSTCTAKDFIGACK